MTLALLAAALLLSLFLVPLGLPGLWVMIGVALLYDLAVGGGAIGWLTLAGVAVFAGVAEVIEFVLGGRFAQRYGGSKRSAWGAILGGLVGAVVGVPVPIVGPMIGAFAGAFAGAMAGELSLGRSAEASTRVATGAVLGRVAAVAVKIGVGMAMAVWLLLAAWR